MKPYIEPPLTVADIQSMPDDGNRYEVIEGELAKRGLYSVRGVIEYWIVDPATQSIELYRKRKEGGLKLTATLQSDDELTSTVLPGFRMPIEPLFVES
jgi:Uma2 family endonuclease